jgi:hypothetical protein
MKTYRENWTIKKLTENLSKIEFPEFQREPTVWRLDKKQRLIDSILRDFDISSIYFYKKKKEGFDCIDGRQRINAITSYLGLNGDDIHNKFHLMIENEIYDDKGKFDDVNELNFENLKKPWPDKILNYKLNIVIIDEVEDDEELNLLFLRLQIAAVLNAGEKLHAMIGDMHDEIFYNIAKHAFFQEIKIPQRRYAREQVASQIVINVFSLHLEDSFHRARFDDLQDFYKQYASHSIDDKKLIKEITSDLDKIKKLFKEKLKVISNRALAVSIFLICRELILNKKEGSMPIFVDFIELFLKTYRWQIKKGVLMDEAYYDFLKFQTNITQAAAEKTAIEKRHNFLKEYFYHYTKTKEIKGDDVYKKKRGSPNNERKNIKL